MASLIDRDLTLPIRKLIFPFPRNTGGTIAITVGIAEAVAIDTVQASAN
jgi:hypothetical protein